MSSICKKSDIHQWHNEKIFDLIKETPRYHRKYWEIGFIISNLLKLNLLSENKTGIGFGCGEEKIVSAFVDLNLKITATDQPRSNESHVGWYKTNQYCNGIETFLKHTPTITTIEKIKKNLVYEDVDMNKLSDNPNKKYDFLWSCSSLEHLGSIKNSIKFIVNSMNYLKNNGVAIHITEFNWHDDLYYDDPYNCCFNKEILSNIFLELRKKGCKPLPINYELGDSDQDKYIDEHPFVIHNNPPLIYDEKGESHFKLKIKKKYSTSIGFIVFNNKYKLI